MVAKIRPMDRNKQGETVDIMIRIYCHKKHHTKGKELCQECQELSSYCHYRLSLCPHGDKKPFCSNCRIHCYDKAHREKIREVMRFSGPRMIFHRPILAFRHVISTKAEARRLAKEEKKKKAENDR